MEHRIGGLERRDLTGELDLSADNHQKMVNLRAEKIERVREDIPRTRIFGDPDAELLIIGWGSSYGAITRAVMNQNAKGNKVASIHLRHINPFPKDLSEILARFPRRIVAENNLGQLWTKLRAEYLLEMKRHNKVQGTPFRISEIEEVIEKALGENS
jgi:2-oxoglutarate ferredoxin oxidoreductase subunit alpha